jgi:hypothetical protein
MKKDNELPIVLATIAGFIMVAATMLFGIANTALINNNNIGLEDAKAKMIYNLSLKDYGEVNSLIIMNNQLAKQYSTITVVFFAVSLFLGLAAFLLALQHKVKNNVKKEKKIIIPSEQKRIILLNKSDMTFIGQLLLVVGGFVLAETIVKNFLEVARDVLPWYILPCMAVLMLIMANNLLQNTPTEFGGWAGSIYLILSIILIVLLKKEKIASTFFLFLTLGAPILYLVVHFLLKKKIGQK